MSSTKHKLRIKDIINLAAPQTWSASVIPSILATVLSYIETGKINILLTICFFLVAVLMQSAVNTLNDYADFKKGTDTINNSPDETDAVIVYGLNPKTARNIGIIFLLIAFIIGMYLVYICGLKLLIIGLIGALVVITYSLGKIPISYLPLGEIISGFVMGGLIPLAGYLIQTKTLNFEVLLYSIPLMLGISMIMFSNNSCDIEKDTTAKRHTLSVLLGRNKTSVVYKVLLIIYIISPLIILFFKGNPILYLLELLVLINIITKQLKIDLIEKNRLIVMSNINNLNIELGLAYIVALML